METDYPAAHSMDTTWFAVDRDGHVGIFDSGEPGVVPASWSLATPTPDDLLDAGVPEEDLPYGPPYPKWPTDDLSDAKRGLAWYDLWRFWAELYRVILYQIARAAPHHALRNPPGPEGLHAAECPEVMLLSEIEMIQARLVGRVSPIEETGVVLARVASVDSKELRRIHDAGACGGCFGFDGLEHRLGVFSYECDWGLVDYQRVDAGPVVSPVHVDELPALIRSTVGRLRFKSLSFRGSERICPEDHFLCFLYGGPWNHNMLTKKIYPMRGKVDAYRDLYPRLLEWGEENGYTVEPPPEKWEEDEG